MVAKSDFIKQTRKDFYDADDLTIPTVDYISTVLIGICKSNMVHGL